MVTPQMTRVLPHSMSVEPVRRAQCRFENAAGEVGWPNGPSARVDESGNKRAAMLNANR